MKEKYNNEEWEPIAQDYGVDALGVDSYQELMSELNITKKQLKEAKEDLSRDLRNKALLILESLRPSEFSDAYLIAIIDKCDYNEARAINMHIMLSGDQKSVVIQGDVKNDAAEK